jgi:hypothetical protein
MGYDKAWILEEDMIAPKDALKKLLEVDAPVVSGYYMLRHGNPSSNIFLGMTGVSKAKDLARMYPNDETIETVGGAMGCLLLDRSVLENCSFILKENCAPDTDFMAWCVRNKIKQMARLDVKCGHIRADGKVLYPDNTNENGWRLESA